MLSITSSIETHSFWPERLALVAVMAPERFCARRVAMGLLDRRIPIFPVFAVSFPGTSCDALNAM